MSTETVRNEAAARPTQERIEEWMQGWVDYTLMEILGTAEIEGSAFARPLQDNIRTFIESAERDLGIVLDGRGDLTHDYWTPEKHNAYHRTAERRTTVERISHAIDRIELSAPSADRVEGHLEVLGAVQTILDEEAAR